MVCLSELRLLGEWAYQGLDGIALGLPPDCVVSVVGLAGGC